MLVQLNYAWYKVIIDKCNYNIQYTIQIIHKIQLIYLRMGLVSSFNLLLGLIES